MTIYDKENLEVTINNNIAMIKLINSPKKIIVYHFYNNKRQL